MKREKISVALPKNHIVAHYSKAYNISSDRRWMWHMYISWSSNKHKLRIQDIYHTTLTQISLIKVNLWLLLNRNLETKLTWNREHHPMRYICTSTYVTIHNHKTIDLMTSWQIWYSLLSQNTRKIYRFVPNRRAELKWRGEERREDKE